ncbi:epoxide hydrolase, putative [Ricinus communis]|uniref:Epoxide hydrolase, putative n=1 Tax=Ricinus communis TaxID=3988 RepID=B9RT85_RICCO|nr:epoxide hydrolase, putative [Ricinus communis]
MRVPDITASGSSFFTKRNWELLAPWTGAQVKVPTRFIVGDQDLVYNSLCNKDYIEKGGFKRDVPTLQEVVVMEGVAHFLNQEKPDEISKHIANFIQKF